ncbi:MAG TPA: type II toxin-antitoxin system VapC family toxin [Caulobacterales bacterium]|jgi:PIN domain nuclease of toxin-antitoxin system|nr:type II toxin-antitoxin system VapC family toxin [Caulobacterales bacterium]
MRLLLDTCALLWWLEDSGELSLNARREIDRLGNTIFVSSISLYEIALKVHIGKLTLPGRTPSDVPGAIDTAKFVRLSVTMEHGLIAGQLKLAHKDPWDWLLAAQALVEDVAIVSDDNAFDRLGVERLW